MAIFSKTSSLAAYCGGAGMALLSFLSSNSSIVDVGVEANQHSRSSNIKDVQPKLVRYADSDTDWEEPLEVVKKFGSEARWDCKTNALKVDFKILGDIEYFTMFFMDDDSITATKYPEKWDMRMKRSNAPDYHLINIMRKDVTSIESLGNNAGLYHQQPIESKEFYYSSEFYRFSYTVFKKIELGQRTERDISIDICINTDKKKADDTNTDFYSSSDKVTYQDRQPRALKCGGYVGITSKSFVEEEIAWGNLGCGTMFLTNIFKTQSTLSKLHYLNFEFFPSVALQPEELLTFYLGDHFTLGVESTTYWHVEDIHEFTDDDRASVKISQSKNDVGCVVTKVLNTQTGSSNKVYSSVTIRGPSGCQANRTITVTFPYDKKLIQSKKCGGSALLTTSMTHFTSDTHHMTCAACMMGKGAAFLLSITMGFLLY